MNSIEYTSNILNYYSIWYKKNFDEIPLFLSLSTPFGYLGRD